MIKGMPLGSWQSLVIRTKAEVDLKGRGSSTMSWMMMSTGASRKFSANFSSKYTEKKITPLDLVSSNGEAVYTCLVIRSYKVIRHESVHDVQWNEDPSVVLIITLFVLKANIEITVYLRGGVYLSHGSRKEALLRRTG